MVTVVLTVLHHAHFQLTKVLIIALRSSYLFLYLFLLLFFNDYLFGFLFSGCFGDNASSRSSEAESTDNNLTLTPKYRYSYFYGAGNRQSSSSTAISLNHASEPPKKRGRPRKLPDIARLLPADVSEPCKKKRGRPRKYLKLELARISSTV